ncbi:DUF3037 domain-containing protein [Streptomyces sp. P38-E01]|uniref:DUF3037 domain-containing protein n=1 Tax=Streptomyces tardus TaxID=2780544 RepID=A0A949JHF9_9ACTN|nr:DUF3037 domain-containing protein [Streptomyces tardus]MBU7600077.1 DUF3037 domain-containing protein [Streptomyces tardus]
MSGRPERAVFEYALLRIVPRAERGEQMNAGVVLYCRPRSFLATLVHLDEERLRALDPSADVAGVRAALGAFVCVSEGGAAAGQASGEEPGRRFRWLVAPRSTVLRAGPVHLGLTVDPAAEVRRLLKTLVR